VFLVGGVGEEELELGAWILPDIAMGVSPVGRGEWF